MGGMEAFRESPRSFRMEKVEKYWHICIQLLALPNDYQYSEVFHMQHLQKYGLMIFFFFLEKKKLL